MRGQRDLRLRGPASTSGRRGSTHPRGDAPKPLDPVRHLGGDGSDTRELLVVALRAVASSPEWADARAGLMLRDIVPIDAAKYEVLVDYEREAAALGYPVLC